MRKILLTLLIATSLAIFAVLTFFFYQRRKTSPKYTGTVEKIIFSSSPDIKSGAIYVAQSKGYFHDEGLEVDIREIPSAKTAFLNMLNGEVDIAAVTEVPIMSASFDREDFYIIATINYALDDKVIVRGDRNIKLVRDLKGKKIGLSGKGTSTYFFLTTLLRYNNILDSDVEIVFKDPDKLTSSLKDGTLDAIVLWEPFAFEAKQALQDKAVVFSNQGIYRKTFNFTVKKEFAKNHPETLKRFLKAIDKATEFINTNQQESQAIIAKWLNLKPEEVSRLWGETSYTLSLDQSLLLLLEDEARWAINNKLTDAAKIPNYLDYIYFDALDAVKPEAVTIIR